MNILLIIMKTTQNLMTTNSTLKHKVVYIARFLARKHKIEDSSDLMSTKYLESLNRGGLTVPTFNVVYFVHASIHIHENLPTKKKHCHRYLSKVMNFIDVPFSSDTKICRTLVNIISKGYVQSDSDRENQIGCLRRAEKLSSND